MDNAPKQRIWDLPVRLFHWILVLLVVLLYLTGEGIVLDMNVHMLSGLGVLTLLVFRVLWGLIGSETARFSSFVRGPLTALGYLRDTAKGTPPHYLGHNPAGGLMVLLLLALLAAQAITGLFSSDDILSDGPLVGLVSSSTVGTMTWLHHLIFNGVLAAVILHVAAAFLYLLVKKENLIRPMVTGLRPAIPGTSATFASPLLALVVLAVSAAVVWGIVSLG